MARDDFAGLPERFQPSNLPARDDAYTKRRCLEAEAARDEWHGRFLAMAEQMLADTERIEQDDAQLTALRAENARLREALEQIAVLQYMRADAEEGSLTEHVDMARAALSGAPPDQEVAKRRKAMETKVCIVCATEWTGEDTPNYCPECGGWSLSIKLRRHEGGC